MAIKRSSKKGSSISEPVQIKVAKVGDFVGNKAILPIKVISSTKSGIQFPQTPFDLEIVYGGDNHKITLSENMLSTNAQEQSEGPIRNLIDGNAGTYFHSNWSNPGAINQPHYIQVSLNESVKKNCFCLPK
ncbi:discoidin domain-containing protein [Capnocytophaga canimorsus]|nr:discoidin domain-containing protein [Capnocytophaga canimorsus]WGU70496.1 discoidin domain-containing protein [Capnocytophaga canimorsus]